MGVEGGSSVAEALTGTRPGGMKSSARALASQADAQPGFAQLMDALLPGQDLASATGDAADDLQSDGVAALQEDDGSSQSLDALLAGWPVMLPEAAPPEPGADDTAHAAGAATMALGPGRQARRLTADGGAAGPGVAWTTEAQAADGDPTRVASTEDSGDPGAKGSRRLQVARVRDAAQAERAQTERAAHGDEQTLRLQDPVPASERRMEVQAVSAPASLVEVASGHGAPGATVTGPGPGVPDAAPSPAVGVSSFADAEAVPAAPRQIAEQVHFWLTHDIQHAELRLAGQGQEAVEIHIAMEGRQARVEFLCNQAEIRQLLEDSAPHLREQLREDGLVLAGFAVGSSDARQPSSQGRPAGTRVRQAAVSAAGDAAHDPGQAQPWAGRTLAGARRVDLYV